MRVTAMGAGQSSMRRPESLSSDNECDCENVHGLDNAVGSRIRESWCQA